MTAAILSQSTDLNKGNVTFDIMVITLITSL